MSITSRIIIVAKDEVTSTVKKLEKTMKNYKKQVYDTSDSLKKFQDENSNVVSVTELLKLKTDDANSAIKRYGDVVKKSANKVNLLETSMKKIIASFAAWKVATDITETAVQFDSLERTMFAALGSMEKTGKALEYTKEKANSLGLEYFSLTDNYKRLAAAFRGTELEGEETNRLFMALSKASVSLQLSTDDTIGIFRAIDQIMSKGVVSSEELRGQLGERLPRAFQISAKAMGMTTKELNNFMSQGKLFSVEFLPRLARQLDIEFANSYKNASKSLRSDINRLKNSWYELKLEISEAGFLDILQESIKDISNYVNQLDKISLKGNFEKFFSTISLIVNGVKKIADYIPGGTTTLAMGLIGTKLFGSTPGLIIGMFTAINAILDKFDMGIDDSVKKLKELHNSFIAIDSVFAGKKDWKTGKSLENNLEALEKRKEHALFELRKPLIVGKDFWENELKEVENRIKRIKNELENRKNELKPITSGFTNFELIGMPLVKPKLEKQIPFDKNEYNLKELIINEQKKFKIQQEITNKIKQMTLNSLDYKKWSYNNEIEKYQELFEKKQITQDQFNFFQNAVNKKIKQEELKINNEKKQLQNSLVDRIKRITLDEFDYKKWSYEEDLKEYKKLLKNKKITLDQFDNVQNAINAKIKKEDQKKNDAIKKIQDDLIQETKKNILSDFEFQKWKNDQELKKYKQMLDEKKISDTAYYNFKQSIEYRLNKEKQNERDKNDQNLLQIIYEKTLSDTDYKAWLVHKKIDSYKNLLKKGLISQDIFQKYSKIVKNDLYTDDSIKIAIKNTLNENQQQFDSYYKKIKHISDNTFKGMQTSFKNFFSDAIMLELKSVEDYFKSFLSTIAGAISDILANQLTTSIFEMLPKNTTTKKIGGRSIGGAVQKNEAVLVGERGVELLLMGNNSSGYVIPNHKLLSSDNNNNNNNNNNNFKPTININIKDDYEANQTQLNNVLNIDIVKKSISADIRQGGTMVSKAIEGTYGLNRGLF